MYKCTGDNAFLAAYGTIFKNTSYSWFKVYKLPINVNPYFKADLRPEGHPFPKNDITHKVLTIKGLHQDDAGLYSYRPSDSKDITCGDYNLKILSEYFINLDL